MVYFVSNKELVNIFDYNLLFMENCRTCTKTYIRRLHKKTPIRVSSKLNCFLLISISIFKIRCLTSRNVEILGTNVFIYTPRKIRTKIWVTSNADYDCKNEDVFCIKNHLK